MTRLYNDPADFSDELIDGFVAANNRWVRKVRGGVARVTPTEQGTVAVVTGGGSGHYPAFGGFVGDGFADGAAMGNVFASPSAQQVFAVAKSVERGAGVLLTYGNYAGDTLQFGLAQDRLRMEGTACETVVVTDDIASAPNNETQRRRGIVGDFVVIKVAGAAARDRLNLQEVKRVALKANERTRSLGVAFTGCTLPGAEQPLFTIPAGRMAIGMGIHGEPGLDEVDIPTADDLAKLLVTQVLSERPRQINSNRVAVILNGLGGVKYEELFVLYRSISKHLEAAGLTIIEPEVGELITSFDMAGTSLTVTWLDDELEKYWRAPADTPSYRKTPAPITNQVITYEDFEQITPAVGPCSAESHTAAQCAAAIFSSIRALIDAHVTELGEIDAVAGDGDHGIGMQRGATAAEQAVQRVVKEGAGLGTTLAIAADAWSDRAGGTSGALWGVILRSIADTVGDSDAPSTERLAAGITLATSKVMELGGAQVGDKTLVDTLVPFSAALSQENVEQRLGQAWGKAVPVALKSAQATADLLPQLGRARTHHAKSLGHVDAGAYSLALIIEAISPLLANCPPRP